MTGHQIVDVLKLPHAKQQPENLAVCGRNVWVVCRDVFNFPFWSQNEILIPAKICSWNKVEAFWGRTKDTCICFAHLDFWHNFCSHCLLFSFLSFTSHLSSTLFFFFLTPVVLIPFAFLLFMYYLLPTLYSSLLWHYFGCKRVFCLLWAKKLNCSNKKQLLWDVSLVFHICGNDWKKLREMSWKFSILFHYLYRSKHARCMVLPPEVPKCLCSIMSHS